MKKHRWYIIMVFIFIVGLSVLLYPIISKIWNQRNQSGVVHDYNYTVGKISQDEAGQLLKEAEEYNAKLQEVTAPFRNFDLVEGYEDVLDISGTGIMGYLVIDKINTELPIYHGTSEGVLQIAVGHLQGSSLPIGGTGTHAVLSAHNGLPEAELFTHLEQMEVGDTFTIYVLDKILTYQVDQIRVVEPDDKSALYAEPEKDYCTLMTCTPYGVNTHRLLVRGLRVEENGSGAYLSGDAYQIDTEIVSVWIFILILLMILLVFIPVNFARHRRTDMKGE